MIVDFHAHVFPNRIAAGTIAHLSEKGNTMPHSDGTVDGLLCKMRAAGVDVAVNLPVLTSPRQFDSVIQFAREINERPYDGGTRIISFAGIHPLCEDLEGKMRYVKKLGFLGVKIHPDYQATFINDEKYVRICLAAKELDLIVVTHSGEDVGFPNGPIHSTPKLALDLIKRVQHEKLVFAHLGASRMSKEVIETLAGDRVYFDTAYVLKYTEREDFVKILEKHGADRILFGSDTPWSDIGADADIIRSFNLGRETEEKIFSENARALLGI